MTSHTRARLAAFKADTGRYAGPAGEWDRAEQEAERERAERARLRAKIDAQFATEAAARGPTPDERIATRRLKTAARALPLVYGPPPGTEAVKAAVRRAKALCSSMPALQALEECAVDCALADVVDAVLAMRGAAP